MRQVVQRDGLEERGVERNGLRPSKVAGSKRAMSICMALIPERCRRLAKVGGAAAAARACAFNSGEIG